MSLRWRAYKDDNSLWPKKVVLECWNGDQCVYRGRYWTSFFMAYKKANCARRAARLLSV